VTDILDLIDGVIADFETSDDAARFVPEQERTSTPAGDVIDAFSRADAITAGVLVAVPDDLARETGFRYPVALTSAAWEDCVAWSDADNRRKGTVQDETGRLWEVLWMAKCAIRRSPGTAEALFRLYRVPRDGRGRAGRPIRLKAVCGPGDEGEPVITIMQRGES
jgi:hypothetical protein